MAPVRGALQFQEHPSRASLQVGLQTLSACLRFGASLLLLHLQPAQADGVLSDQVLELIQRLGRVLGDVEVAVVGGNVQGDHVLSHASDERLADVKEGYVREAAAERVRVGMDLRIHVVCVREAALHDVKVVVAAIADADGVGVGRSKTLAAAPA